MSHMIIVPVKSVKDYFKGKITTGNTSTEVLNDKYSKGLKMIFQSLKEPRAL